MSELQCFICIGRYVTGEQTHMPVAAATEFEGTPYCQVHAGELYKSHKPFTTQKEYYEIDWPHEKKTKPIVECAICYDEEGSHSCIRMAHKVPKCTRQEPHICQENGPCNGWPRSTVIK